MPKQSYIEDFPLQKIRREQSEAIEFALNAFESGKRFVIAELGVGSGKSAVGLTVARYMARTQPRVFSPEMLELRGAYVLTTQKILQEQYIRDFGPETPLKVLRSIKSSSNYECNFYPEQSCAESRRVLSKLKTQLTGTDFMKCCGGGKCKYSVDKAAFLESPVGVTNFAYFLAETMYAGKLVPRQLLVIDEAHNIESQLSSFVEVTFSERFAKSQLTCPSPKSNSQEDVFQWVKTKYKKSLSKRIKELEGLIGSSVADTELTAVLSMQTKQYEQLDKHICKVNRFISSYTPENWVMNVVRTTDGKTRKFEFKPIDVAEFSHEALFKYGDKVLMMSATIVDKDVFCRSIGIDPAEVAFISIPSPFPPENRPVHYLPVGSMSANNIDSTLPVMAAAVKMLLDSHPDAKGIIHATTYKIAQYIKENVKSSRILIHDASDRDEVLRKHVEGPGPTVLLSPSMMEGVDLADDASRFQILCKVPYPYLGDLVTKRRMEKDKGWYPYQTAKSIIQALGRSIRNLNDHAESYILDSDWDRFFTRSRHLFSESFTKALT